MGTGIQLRVLGSVELEGNGKRTFRTILAQPKRVALLTYLALAQPRGWHRRDELQAVFWPERDKKHAQCALRNSLHFLRQRLGETVVLRRGIQEVSLASSALWCDAVAFEKGALSGEPDACTRLYRGNLLEGFFIREAPEFERWLEVERARLSELYEYVIGSLAEGAAAERRWVDQVRWRRRLTRLDPYNSRYVFEFMEALLQAGEPANAIRAAAEHRRFVQDDLGVEPAAEVLELAKILRESMPHQAAALDTDNLLDRPDGRSRSVLLANSNGEATEVSPNDTGRASKS
jgi:DNA-binding SARP family transcriptional activator